MEATYFTILEWALPHAGMISPGCAWVPILNTPPSQPIPQGHPSAQNASFLPSTLNPFQEVSTISSCSSTRFNPCGGRWQVQMARASLQPTASNSSRRRREAQRQTVGRKTQEASGWLPGLRTELFFTSLCFLVLVSIPRASWFLCSSITAKWSNSKGDGPDPTPCYAFITIHMQT